MIRLYWVWKPLVFNASFLCLSVTGYHNIIHCPMRNSKCPTHVICDNVPYPKRDVKRV